MREEQKPSGSGVIITINDFNVLIEGYDTGKFKPTPKLTHLSQHLDAKNKDFSSCIAHPSAFFANKEDETYMNNLKYAMQIIKKKHGAEDGFILDSSDFDLLDDVINQWKERRPTVTEKNATKPVDRIYIISNQILSLEVSKQIKKDQFPRKVAQPAVARLHTSARE